MTPDQCLIIALASEIGAQYKVPELPNIVVVESEAGREIIGRYYPAYGIAQFEAQTAIETIKRHPEMWDKDPLTEAWVIWRLLTNNEWSLRLAALRIIDLKADGYPIEAYNTGKKGFHTNKRAVKRYKNKLKIAEGVIQKCPKQGE